LVIFYFSIALILWKDVNRVSRLLLGESQEAILGLTLLYVESVYSYL